MNNLDRFKFRVFIKKHDGITVNKMYYQTSIDYKHTFPAREEINIYVGTTSFCRYFTLMERENGRCQFPDKNEIVVMQCTGLKDKHGKLIYEGDIIRYTLIHDDGTEELEDCNFTQIQFRDSMFCFIKNVNTEHEYYESLFVEDGIWDPDFEVIGNIYENPELLKSI